MVAILFFFFLSSVSASSVESFRDKGLQYEEFGKARLMLEREQCSPRKLDMSKYVDALVEDEVSYVDGLILRAKLQSVFADACHSFNLSTGGPSSTEATENNIQKEQSSLKHFRASGYLDRYRLLWTAQKFDNDLRSLFLYNKINPAFFSIVDQKWFDKDSDLSEAAAAAIAFPTACNIEGLSITALICSKYEASAPQGVLYAIVHAGQFMPGNHAFVHYEVPEYVIVNEDEDEITPVEFDSCRVTNGSAFLCMERAHGECDITTMDSCDIFAMSTATNFTLIRTYGTGQIVATNQQEVNITGTMVKAASPIFTHHISYEMEETEDDESRLISYSKTVAVENEVSFPSMSHSANDAVHAANKAIRLYRLTRKGIPLLSNQVRISSFSKIRGNQYVEYLAMIT
ncbi:hypothetical protein GCK32_007307 [Trichostrongylus colubriformis]|uniref:Uncharacterized protein n=1 Tax=Trichostrongylus colubriformis TaxID=6319 RepID=A0AAN8F8K7_TRICO